MKRALVALLLVGCVAQKPSAVLEHADAQRAVQLEGLEADIVALLQPCRIPGLKGYTTADATNVANARRAALIKCNEDKAALRALLLK